jgi:hypothetical protein
MSSAVSSFNASTSSELVGWVEEEPIRGTYSILRSSLLTILICTWTAIHPRIHSSKSLWHWHKGLVFVKMILCPEMVCIEALQELIQAIKMKRRASARTGGDLKLAQAFYIGMLGVRYRTDKGHRVLWPAQYVWLLNNRLVDWDNHETWGLSIPAIRDKNKADGLVKLATVCQVLWFTLQCIVREAHGLPIAPLEAMTLAYVFVAVVTYGFWWKKPKDITVPSIVDIPKMTKRQQQLFERLAMDFAYDFDRDVPPPSRNIAWYLVARDCKGDFLLLEDQGRDRVEAWKMNHDHTVSDPKIVTEWDETLYMSKWWPLIVLLGAAFGAFHLISWNAKFPTLLELWLWRGCALASVATSIVCMQFRTMSLHWDGPLTIVRVASPVIYLLSRFVITVQVFASLRAMTKSTYETYEVWDYWFHLF